MVANVRTAYVSSLHLLLDSNLFRPLCLWSIPFLGTEVRARQ